MYEKEVLPYALYIGISVEDFWKANPRIMSAYMKANDMKIKEQDRMNWYLGQYITVAIGSCFGKNVKYPEEPFLNDLGLSQEEIDDREIKKMIQAEEAWISLEKRKGLAETKI